MTEVLFFLSVGFLGYVAYVLVDEQKASKSLKPIKPILTVKPPKPKATRKPAVKSAKQKKPTTPKKSATKPISPGSDPIISYLGKNGLTTIAKLSQELPESRKMIEERVERLIQEGALSLTTIRRAKAVALKG